MTAPQHLLQLAAKLGLEESTLPVLKVMPLVYVAWSDGELQVQERDAILATAPRLAIDTEEQLAILHAWLEQRPSEDFFRAGLHTLAYLLASLDEQAGQRAADDVAEFCALVAQAAGGLAGHRERIDPAEAIAMREVVMQLRLASRQSSRDALRKLLEAKKTVVL